MLKGPCLQNLPVSLPQMFECKFTHTFDTVYCILASKKNNLLFSQHFAPSADLSCNFAFVVKQVGSGAFSMCVPWCCYICSRAGASLPFASLYSYKYASATLPYPSRRTTGKLLWFVLSLFVLGRTGSLRVLHTKRLHLLQIYLEHPRRRQPD